MNKSFNFFTPTQLLFGPGRLEDLKDIAPKYGSKCLLVSRPLQGSLKFTYKRIEKLLNSVNIEDLEYGGAEHYAKTYKAIKEVKPNTAVQALTPDFKGL